MKLWSAVSTAVFSIALIAAMLPTAASAVGTVPPAPTGVTGTAGNGTVTVKWVAPSSDGGSAIIDYKATASPGGASCVGTVPTTGCPIVLTNGVSYTFTVTARNANGSGAASAPSSPVIPGTTPGTPGIPAVAGTGTTGEVALSWAAPASSGGAPITAYTVVSATGTPAGGCTTTGATTCTATGLGSTSTYTFKVKATNSFGSSALSAASSAITPGALSGAPTLGTITPGNAQITVAWTAPTPVVGAPVTGYTLVAVPGGRTATAGASGTSATVTGLTNGVPYVITVRATNKNGTGAGAATGSTKPLTKPGVPTNVVAANNAASGALVITWDAPASFGGGGAPGTGAYTATASPGGGTCSTASTAITKTTCTITAGLSDGVSYTVTVHSNSAVAAVGKSAESAPSAAAIPGPVTGAPTLAFAAPTGNSGQLKVTWQPPVTATSPVTLYTVTQTVPTTGTIHSCTSTTNVFCTVSGLTNGTGYRFTVTAKNAAGTSAASNVTGTAATPGTPADVAPSTTPGVPTGLVATAFTSTSGTLTWVAPTSTGSSAITSYKLTVSPAVAGSPFTITAPTVTKAVAGFSDGTAYTFTVQATNANGSSAASSAVVVTPSATIPSIPTAVTAAPITGQVTVGWAIPAVVGTGVTGYTVTAAPTGGGTAVTGSPFTIAAGTFTKAITGLTNGTSYTFTVAAKIGSTTGAAATIVQKAGVLPGLTTGTFARSFLSGPIVRASGWAVPTTGTPITNYVVNAYIGASTTSSGTCSSLVDFTCDITGLTPGQSYNLKVRAVNAIGNGPQSASLVAAVPATVAAAPTGVAATSNETGKSTVTFVATPLASNGGSAITDYKVTAVSATTGATTPVTEAVTSTSELVVLSGLTNGAAYTFTVQAINGTGTSAASAASAAATPSGIAAAPTSIVGVAGNGQVTLSWVAPVSTGGSAIVGYRVTTATPAGNTAGCTSTGANSCTVMGLSNGSAYTFSVQAQTSTTAGTPKGFGTAGTSGAVTPIGAPGVPTGLAGTGGNGSAALTWTAPSSNGSSAIILYTVTASPGGATCLTSGVTSASCTVSGLTNGTFYTFSVVATNAAGSSAGSAATAPIQARAGAALDTTVNHAFTDVGTVGTEAANAIAALFNTTPAITQGMNSTTYGPLVPVNRANMAVFLSRSIQAVGHTVNTTVNHTFADVAGLTAEQQSSIAAIGNTTPAITNGATATSYAPAATVSRQEMAAFLSRTWQSLGGTCDSTVNHTFGDIGTSFAQADIACVNNLGIANGTSATTFDPAAPVNRLQMALFLFRLVDAAVAQGL